MFARSLSSFAVLAEVINEQVAIWATVHASSVSSDFGYGFDLGIFGVPAIATSEAVKSDTAFNCLKRHNGAIQLSN